MAYTEAHVARKSLTELLNGQKVFHRLTVLGEGPEYVCPSGYVTRRAQCQCECGKMTCASINQIKSGRTRSCGCLTAEYRRKPKIGRFRKPIWDCELPEYRTWKSIKRRCYNKNNPDYPDYGGAGIRVCDRWLQSFRNFLQDMGHKPGPEYSIDRINPSGNYEPSNTRWATSTQQARNNKRTQRIMWDGVEQPVIDVCEKLNLNYKSIKTIALRDKLSFGHVMLDFVEGRRKPHSRRSNAPAS